MTSNEFTSKEILDFIGFDYIHYLTLASGLGIDETSTRKALDELCKSGELEAVEGENGMYKRIKA